MSLTSRIQALTAYANEVTGESDTTLADAVATLADGYGQGGGEWSTEGIAGGTEPSGDIVLSTTTTISDYGLCNKPITSIRSTSVTRVNNSGLSNCSSLASVFLPNALVFVNAIRSNASLTVAVVKQQDNSFTFSDDTALTKLDIIGHSSLGYGACLNCTSLATLILRSSTVCGLTAVYAFSNTPFASGGTGGTLYVPQALISSYQSATNWSTILGYTNNQILPIEGSIYETQYADGTSILQ